ncbi:hypothetical protein HDU97_009650, partial [Phlyctochytrium planicorne]
MSNLISLDLSHTELAGDVPVELGNLGNLKEMFLGYSKLTGTIPSSFAGLGALQTLEVNANRLSGSIPDLSSIRSLKRFTFDSNYFNGDIPGFVSNVAER